MCPVAGSATSTPSTPSTSSSPAQSGAADVQTFDTVLRGYERRQVDEFVVEKNKEIAWLKMELAEAHRQRRLATEHAEGTETELRELRASSAHSEPAAIEDSFGYRAEKLLRMAEQEAAEARSHASRESAGIIEQARTEAEKHRHEVEQSLISRASLLEQQAAQRTAELQEREQQIGDQLNAAREQADQLHAAAVRAADRLHEESAAAAEETKLRAETAAKRQLDQAAQEIGRLTTLQTDVRAELARLAQMLAAELSGARHATSPLRRDTMTGDSKSSDKSGEQAPTNGRQAANAQAL
jgi:chromosome segregation ATPase